MRQRDDGCDQSKSFFTMMVEAVGKELVHLQLSRAELLEVGQARVSGAEVVDRDTKSQGLKVVDHACALLGVLHGDRLSDLEGRLLRGDAGLDEDGVDLL